MLADINYCLLPDNHTPILSGTFLNLPTGNNMKSSELAQTALTRARSSQATSNYGALFDGFLDMGIPADDIQPRVNVLSFHAWRAVGRTVRRGEHGVKLCTWIDAKQADTGESRKLARSVTVFHISQTDAI